MSILWAQFRATQVVVILWSWKLPCFAMLCSSTVPNWRTTTQADNIRFCDSFLVFFEHPSCSLLRSWDLCVSSPQYRFTNTGSTHLFLVAPSHPFTRSNTFIIIPEAFLKSPANTLIRCIAETTSLLAWLCLACVLPFQKLRYQHFGTTFGPVRIPKFDMWINLRNLAQFYSKVLPAQIVYRTLDLFFGKKKSFSNAHTIVCVLQYFKGGMK